MRGCSRGARRCQVVSLTVDFSEERTPHNILRPERYGQNLALTVLNVALNFLNLALTVLDSLDSDTKSAGRVRGIGGGARCGQVVSLTVDCIRSTPDKVDCIRICLRGGLCGLVVVVVATLRG